MSGTKTKTTDNYAHARIFNQREPMQNRMQIDFTDRQAGALKQMAEDQMRSTKMHAQYLVIQALKAAGYLPEEHKDSDGAQVKL